jgi:hypothetical protein
MVLYVVNLYETEGKPVEHNAVPSTGSTTAFDKQAQTLFKSF